MTCSRSVAGSMPSSRASSGNGISGRTRNASTMKSGISLAMTRPCRVVEALDHGCFSSIGGRPSAMRRTFDSSRQTHSSVSSYLSIVR